MDDMVTRLSDIRRRIADAARDVGREPSDVTLVAVSKEVDAAAVLAAAAAGQQDFGENRAQELRSKVDALAARAETLRWHFIGRVQRNKVKAIAASVALWHSVDRTEIGEVVARYAPGARVLIQVNVANEEQKGGCAPQHAAALLGSLDALGLHVEGLMTIPPHLGDPRRHFAALRELAMHLELTTLSMGMSSDFEAAISEGATIVRVGTALFGPRQAGQPSGTSRP